MRSLLDVRLGVETPQIRHLPPDVHSLDAALEAIELADAYLICDGNPLAESQKLTLRGALGERVDGSWAATRVGDFGPRQGTGKNDKIAARELAGLILFGERLQIHTAHEFPTANEAFLRMVAIFENWDDLRRRVSRIRYANGEQGIEFTSGQRLKYRARTGGSGRGFAKADLLVYDEAQHLATEHVAASAPSKLANPNSQTWYSGSGGMSTSKLAWAMRRSAVLGTGGRLAYTEKTAQTFAVVGNKIVWTRPPDPLDRECWYEAMPGLGRWVTEESMMALFEDLGSDPELFAREGLCVWDPEPNQGDGIIPLDSWQACAYQGTATQRLRYALDVDTNASGQEWASIGCSDGTHVEIVTPLEAGPGTAWVIARCVEKKKEIGELLVAGDGPASALIPSLEAAGVAVHKVTPDEFQASSMQMLTAVVDGSVRHRNQPPLNTAVEGACIRDVGDGKWRFSRKLSAVDIGPLNTIAMARLFASIAPAPREPLVSWR